jgi:hypothetical protein
MGAPKMKAEYKIPGGKLLLCEIDIEDEVIKTIKISGDFFMHPEDAINELEETLLGTPIQSYQNEIINFFQERKITLYGVSQQDFITVIQLAIDSE